MTVPEAVGRITFSPPLPGLVEKLAGVSGCVLGVDPGVDLGLVIARRRQPGETDDDTYGYIAVHRGTITTEPGGTVTNRLAFYRPGLSAVVSVFTPDRAYVEVPWRHAAGKKALSVYTHEGRNVGSLALLCAITGCVLNWLDYCGVPVVEVPAPTGKLAKAWEKQKEFEVKGVYGIELKRHEAVAAMLALKGL